MTVGPCLYAIIWNVQHGSAFYLRTPNQTNIVVDLGTGRLDSGAPFSPMLALNNVVGIGVLHELIITHPHRDHLDDIANLGALQPRVLLRPKHLDEAAIREGNRPQDEATIDRYLELHRRYSNPVTYANSPLCAANNGGVEVLPFIPRRAAQSNLNNHSVVCVVSYAGAKMLIPGDNERASWDELLASSEFVRAIAGTDVLIAPHHGREAGFHAPLFDHLAPSVTIISDGRFGDTSATARYDAVTTGRVVARRTGQIDVKKCVTTRRDGNIQVQFYRTENGLPAVDVLID